MRTRLEIYTIDDPVAQPRTPSHINGRTKESLLRILREIDIPATLTYEAYSRRRENGSSPFVPRKSWRNLTSQEETGKPSRAHTQASSSDVYRCTKRNRERERKRGEIKRCEGNDATAMMNECILVPANKEGAKFSTISRKSKRSEKTDLIVSPAFNRPRENALAPFIPFIRVHA